MIRTRVGYAGGRKADPTYRSMGDHTETVQVDYDPGRITYGQLLEISVLPIYGGSDYRTQLRQLQRGVHLSTGHHKVGHQEGFGGLRVRLPGVPLQPLQETVGASTDIVDRFATEDRMGPHRPARHALAGLRGGFALVVAVVPLHKVGLEPDRST